MPNNLRMPDDSADDGAAPSGAVGSGSPEASQRWAAELERDRMAALMMRPSHGFAGPGAADGGSPEEESDDSDENEDADDSDESGDDDGGGKSAAQTAAELALKRTLWGRLAALMLKYPIPTIAIVAPIIGIMVLPFVMQLLVFACAASRKCAWTIGWEIIKKLFSAFTKTLLGG